MIRKEIIVKNKLGLHARPAAVFVQIANKFEAQITVRHDDEEVNGKSIMGILMLGAEKDSLIVVEADGADAEAALVELERLISSEEEL
ncbi:MAG: HPr family phosphocarrier protein [Candidatus Omnitrophota bacterium]|nr:HPr family phosphocarrier protein [Candidatus Omnitrophota bacterium]